MKVPFLVIVETGDTDPNQVVALIQDTLEPVLGDVFVKLNDNTMGSQALREVPTTATTFPAM